MISLSGMGDRGVRSCQRRPRERKTRRKTKSQSWRQNSVWPGLGWSCVAWLWDRGCGLDRQPHLPGSLCYSPGAELDSPVFLLSTSPQKASLYSMDNRDPRKFFMSGERKWVMTKGLGRCPGGTDLVSPSPRLHWLCAPCSLPLRFQLSCAQQPGTMMLWASAPSRSSSWRRYLDFKFSLSFSSYPSHPFAKKKDGLEGGRRHKERMVWRPSTFFINRCNK